MKVGIFEAGNVGSTAACAMVPGGAAAIVLADDVSQKERETSRPDGRNAGIFKEIIPQVIKNARKAILVVASKPGGGHYPPSYKDCPN